MRQKLKNMFVLVVMIGLIMWGVLTIIGGIKEAKAYYERHDKYVTVEGKVRSVYRFGLGYTASVHYDYKGSGHSTYLERRIGIAPKEDDIVKIQVDSVYPIRVRPSSNGIFKIFCGMLIFAFVGYSMLVLKRYKNKEISIKISPKAKRFAKIAIVVLAAWIVANGVDVLISSYFDSRDFDWGLKMFVSDVSSKEITLNLERDDPENSKKLTVGDNFEIEKRTLFGWKWLTPKANVIYMGGGYEICNVDSRSMNLKLEGRFGKLPIGIYRVWRYTTVEDYYRYPEDEREGLKQELYATFIVIW